MSKRDKYFRERTKIGQLEAAALRFALTKGHEPRLVRGDRQSTSVGCYNCDAWGCAEIESKIEIVHGDIFMETCGTTIVEEEVLYASNPALY
jgi:hypothetical protein